MMRDYSYYEEQLRKLEAEVEDKLNKDRAAKVTPVEVLPQAPSRMEKFKKFAKVGGAVLAVGVGWTVMTFTVWIGGVLLVVAGVAAAVKWIFFSSKEPKKR